MKRLFGVTFISPRNVSEKEIRMLKRHNKLKRYKKSIKYAGVYPCSELSGYLKEQQGYESGIPPAPVFMLVEGNEQTVYRLCDIFSHKNKKNPFPSPINTYWVFYPRKRMETYGNILLVPEIPLCLNKKKYRKVKQLYVPDFDSLSLQDKCELCKFNPYKLFNFFEDFEVSETANITLEI
ncbi:MAG: hypothetical protein DRP13_02835 [Candidatus Aenigmatarchaeota archaeon]|nr:MAG: hypothetical protein DRP13_02835 [Candidatus Aenigmarchaeota archaeon]RLJ08255.1 MAG: hypothetical protein DRP16_01815 [Candidatus Aenigmarchaeota archaeon]